MILRGKRGVANTVVANVTTQALIYRSQEEHLKSINFESSSWAKSLFYRMVFIKRTFATSKPKTPIKAKQEAKLLYQHHIVPNVEKCSITLSLILNSHQIL